MYECVAGRVPFKGESGMQTVLKHLNEEPESLAATGCDERISSIIYRCLQKRREDRFQSAAEVLQALNAVRVGGVPLLLQKSRVVRTEPLPILSEKSIDNDDGWARKAEEQQKEQQKEQPKEQQKEQQKEQPKEQPKEQQKDQLHNDDLPFADVSRPTADQVRATFTRIKSRQAEQAARQSQAHEVSAEKVTQPTASQEGGAIFDRLSSWIKKSKNK